MWTPHRLRVVGAVGLCLSLVAVGACTHAEDWRASGTDDSAPIPTYDTGAIQPQPDIIAMLPEGALADGVLDVAAATDYPPAEFLDAGGAAVGYDVHLSQAIARVLGVRAGVGTTYDAGISSFTVTRERTAAMNMIAYINVGSRFNVTAGNPKGIDPSDHLNLCGLTIGVQTGTAQEESINTFSQDCKKAGKPEIEVRSYSTQSEATTALAGSTLDAVYSDSTVAGYAVETTGGQVETVGEIEDALPQGIVLTKNDPALTKAIQAAVQYLMDSGVWQDAWGIEGAALTTAALNPPVEK